MFVEDQIDMTHTFWTNGCNVDVNMMISNYQKSVIIHRFNDGMMIKEWPFGMKGFSFQAKQILLQLIYCAFIRFSFPIKIGFSAWMRDYQWHSKQNLCLLQAYSYYSSLMSCWYKKRNFKHTLIERRILFLIKSKEHNLLGHNGVLSTFMLYIWRTFGI